MDMTLLNSEQPLDILDILDILFTFAIILIYHGTEIEKNHRWFFFKMKLLAVFRNHVCVLSL